VSFVESYISKVGIQSANAMKVILYKLLFKRYQSEHDEDFAASLAAAVANYIFCSEPAEEFKSFAIKNNELIESKCKELSTEDSLCRALTSAIYNFCYGRYVDSGRKIGLLVHPFLGFVRSVRRVMEGKEPVSFLESLYPTVGPENVQPLLNLCWLGLYRSLPNTPDSKEMMEEIARFGKSVG